MSEETIDLAGMTDATFDTLYRSRIEPLFADGDRERAGAVATFRTRLAIGAPLAVVGATVAGVLSKEVPLAVFLGVVGLVISYTVAYLPLQALSDRMKIGALDAISRAIGARYAPVGSPETMPRFRRLDLLPSYDRSRFEDFFHGERQGCAFDICEAVLENEHRDKDGKRSYVTVFRGLMIRLSFPKKFLAVTVVRRDLGIFNALRGFGDLKRVGLGDSTFEKAFEVYSNDQVEARYLVHPVFMERLIELEKLYKGRNLRCGFEDGDLLHAVETSDQFEIGDMFKPLADPTRARRIVNELAAVMKLMDSVLTAELAPLVGRRD